MYEEVHSDRQPTISSRWIITEKYKEGGRVKLNEGGYIGPSIKAEYGGVKLSNPHNKKYYKGLV